MVERRNKSERRKDVRELLEQHFIEDRANFGNIAKALQGIEEHIKISNVHMEVSNKHMEATNTFMESLAWLSDISKGTQLLKRPSLWIFAFIIGLAALFGGLKTLILAAFSWVTPH